MIKIRDEDNMYPINCFKCNKLMEIINRPKKQDDDRVDLLCLNCNTEHVYLLDKKISIAYIPEVQNEGDKTMSKKYDEPDTSTYSIHKSGHVIDKPPAPTPQFTKEIQNQNEQKGVRTSSLGDYIDKSAIYEQDGKQTLPRVGIPEQPTHFKFNDEYYTTIRISNMDALCTKDVSEIYYIVFANTKVKITYYNKTVRDQDYRELTDILTGLTK